jgi:predicted alpha-1,2-mannosidase
MRSPTKALNFILCVLCFAHAAPSAFSEARTTASTAHAPARNFTQYVNTFVGTDNDGNTFPGATVPLGMVQWSPDTTATGWYKYTDAKIRGFSLTHFSGAGCPAYADVPFMPAVGALKGSPGSNWSDYAVAFSHDKERAAPGYYSVALDSGVRVELSATARTGFGVFTFPQTNEARLLINAGGSATGDSDSSVLIVGDREVTGSATSGRFCDSDTSYRVYFAAQFDRPFNSFDTWEADKLNAGAREGQGKQSGAALTFDATRERTVKVKVGVSFVSVENARLNLRAENDGWDFDAVRRKSSATWNDWLGRVSIEGGTDDERRVFYTALYHSLLHPNVFSDVNGEYIGFDQAVHDARPHTQYANFSDWDTYRTVVQLQALLAPRETSDMMQSLVADAEQSGWLPKWPMANDVTAVMGGDSPAALIATAYAFGARSFDARSALGYMVKGATRPGTGIHGYAERARLAEYLARGYVPVTSFKWDNGMTGATSASLEYVTDDFCVAQLAASLGDKRTHADFMRRAQNWQTIFDPETGFIRPRRASGVFLEGFDPDALTPHSEVPWDKSAQAGFEEGNTWQYTWMIPHNYHGLFAAVGGDAEVTRRLDKFFTKLVGWGQPYFNIGNEPSFVSSYAYAWAGAPWRTQATVRRIMTEIYKPTPAGLPGNDDLGATSAWYVWGALGLYPAIPGVGGFVVTSPLFPAATIRTGDGRVLRVNAHGASADNLYVQSLTLDGAPYARAWLPVAALRPKRTTTLAFTLSARPNKLWASRSADEPPSFAEGQAPAVCFIRGEDSLAVRPGGEAPLALGVRLLEAHPLKLIWLAQPPRGLSLRPASGVVEVGADGRPDINLQVAADAHMPPGAYVVPFKLKAASDVAAPAVELPDTVLEVRVVAGGVGKNTTLHSLTLTTLRPSSFFVTSALNVCACPAGLATVILYEPRNALVSNSPAPFVRPEARVHHLPRTSLSRRSYAGFVVMSRRRSPAGAPSHAPSSLKSHHVIARIDGWLKRSV